MDAVKYIRELERMCHSHTCSECELDSLSKKDGYASCYKWRFEHAEEAVSIVERWSEEHPSITNGRMVMELIPVNSRLTNDTGEDNVQMCIAREWWDAPYEEE